MMNNFSFTSLFFLTSSSACNLAYSSLTLSLALYSSFSCSFFAFYSAIFFNLIWFLRFRSSCFFKTSYAFSSSFSSFFYSLLANTSFLSASFSISFYSLSFYFCYSNNSLSYSFYLALANLSYSFFISSAAFRALSSSFFLLNSS